MSKLFSHLSKTGARAYLLRNEHGGGTNADDAIVVNLLCAAGLRVTTGTFQAGKGQGKKLAKKAARSGKYKLLIAFGGDGTINKAIQAAAEAGNITVAAVLGGTVNRISHLLYGNSDSKKPWLNVMYVMQSAQRKIDVGCVEPFSVHLDTGEEKRVPRKLRRRRYFLLSASAGAEAAITKLTDARLKYALDKRLPGGGFIALAATALLHLNELQPFPFKLGDDAAGNGNGSGGEARALTVGDAEYVSEQGGQYVDDGILEGTGVKNLLLIPEHHTDGPVNKAARLYGTVPAGTLMEVDGSLVNLESGLNKLGNIARVTYLYTTRQISMLVPYCVPQVLLSKPLEAPETPADTVPLDGSAFVEGKPITVHGTAWLPRGWWILYGETTGPSPEPIVIRATSRCRVTRSGPDSPNSIAALKPGSVVRVAGKSRPWGLKATQVAL
jgi:diacylglycerol kinase family enzyme